MLSAFAYGFMSGVGLTVAGVFLYVATLGDRDDG